MQPQKKTNEILANYYSKLTGSMILGLRFFTVYGPYGRPDMSIFKFSNLIKKISPSKFSIMEIIIEISLILMTA